MPRTIRFIQNSIQARYLYRGKMKYVLAQIFIQSVNFLADNIIVIIIVVISDD